MKPAPFDYLRAMNAQHALDALADDANRFDRAGAGTDRVNAAGGTSPGGAQECSPRRKPWVNRGTSLHHESCIQPRRGERRTTQRRDVDRSRKDSSAPPGLIYENMG